VKLLAVARVDRPPTMYLDILPLAGGPSIRQFDVPVLSMMAFSISWTRDSKGLIFLDSRDRISNLWLQLLAGGKPRQLTNFLLTAFTLLTGQQTASNLLWPEAVPPAISS
jgi:hypothetical protein